MGTEAYRREILAHARKLGLGEPRCEAGRMWFPTKDNCGATVPYEPASNDRRCLTNAKIGLTVSMRAYCPERLPPCKPRREYRPTKEREEPWLYAWSPDAHTFTQDQEAGKWMMFVNPKRADKVGSQVKREVKAGRLSFHSKMSTAFQLGRSHVLCVYIPDWSDKELAMEVRERLRLSGFKAIYLSSGTR